MRLLSIGDTGTDVMAVEDLLRESSDYSGKTDAIFGKAVQAAVVSFQKRNGLAVDGVIGPLTLSKLLNKPLPIIGPLAREAGFDISKYENDIDWNFAQAQGNKFVIIKCSEGRTIIDSTLKKHWAGAKSVSMIKAPYHFLHYTSTAAQQMETIKQAMGNLFDRGDMGLFVDEEWADGLATAGRQGGEIALELMRLATAFFGVSAGLYTNPNFFLNVPSDLLPGFEPYTLWDASFVTGNPRIPAPWSKLQFWQYTDNAPVGGQPKVDASWFYGTMDDLVALTKK